MLWQHCDNIEFDQVRCNVATTLTQHWRWRLYHDIVAMLPKCWKIIKKIMTLHNVGITLTMFTQHSGNIVWNLHDCWCPTFKSCTNYNILAMLCEPWCWTLKSERWNYVIFQCWGNLLQCYISIVAMLWYNVHYGNVAWMLCECCGPTKVPAFIYVVPTLRNYATFNVATLSLQSCRKTRIKNLISHFKNEI